jgi:hypothetical protein
MSTTIQIVLFVCIVVVLAVDVLNIRKNTQLQEQINVCADLHRRLLGIVIEQEDVISTELDNLYNDIWGNNFEKLLMQMTEKAKCNEITLCPIHEQLISAYIEWQSYTAAKIKHIKRKQSSMTGRMKKTLGLEEDCDCGNNTNNEE